MQRFLILATYVIATGVIALAVFLSITDPAMQRQAVLTFDGPDGQRMTMLAPAPDAPPPDVPVSEPTRGGEN